jgi:hypothetical protein
MRPPQTLKKFHSPIMNSVMSLEQRTFALISTIDGIPLRLRDVCKKQVFTFCRISENIQFFEHVHSKIAKKS